MFLFFPFDISLSFIRRFVEMSFALFLVDLTSDSDYFRIFDGREWGGQLEFIV